MLEKLIALYGALLSTVLAIPVIRDAWKNYFTSIRFLCIDYTRNDLEKGVPGMKLFHLFDITVVNISKETKHLSNISIELKRGKQKTLVTLSDLFINTDFSNKAEPGQSFKQYARYEYSHLKKKLAEDVDMVLFDEYRVTIENSRNNTFSSKWLKSELYFDRKTVMWKHSKSDSLLI